MLPIRLQLLIITEEEAGENTRTTTNLQSEGAIAGNESGINMKVIRYADVLLMMAECEANICGDLPAAVALMNQGKAESRCGYARLWNRCYGCQISGFYCGRIHGSSGT